MRGRFTPEPTTRNGASAGCCRASTIYTLKRLRAEIEPVAARDFLRFLFDWQHVRPTREWQARRRLIVLAQLEGFEAPAAAWESRDLAGAACRL